MILFARDKTSISVLSADALMQRITEKVIKLRKDKGYSQSDMAERFGISQMAYSKIESGKTDIGFAKAFLFCEILEVTFSDLLGLEAEISQTTHKRIIELETENLSLKNDLNDKSLMNSLLRDKLRQAGIVIN